MLDREALLNQLKRTFGNTVQLVEIHQLAGDASDRTYHRIAWEEREKRRSCILMALAGSKSAMTSEEITGTAAESISELPFLNIQRHLFNCNIPVPEIYDYAPGKGWLLLEDLGNATFADHIAEDPDNEDHLSDLYQQAIDLLISIQLCATSIPNEKTVAHTRRYDASLFQWEFDHFIEYGIEKRNGAPLSPTHKKNLQSHFSGLSAHFAALPKFFTHRDYHSRNLMVQSGGRGIRLRVIDFQDALMGPAEYDLASLLRDSYIELPQGLIDTLLHYYIRQWKARAHSALDFNLFKESFDLISFQRNLKAAGRFVYIDQVKHKNHLLPFVTPTLLKAKHTLGQYGHLKPLYDLLAEVVPEFQSP
ncbi:MAG: aminoglycoside phosphotransferase family protein [Nitrospiria bacterium]